MADESAAKTIDVRRQQELDHLIRKMGGIASVFEVRSDTAGDPHFTAFREMMDVYLSPCRNNLQDGRDFMDSGVELTDDEKQHLAAAFEKVFGFAPGA